MKSPWKAILARLDGRMESDIGKEFAPPRDLTPGFVAGLGGNGRVSNADKLETNRQLAKHYAATPRKLVGANVYDIEAVSIQVIDTLVKTKTILANEIDRLTNELANTDLALEAEYAKHRVLNGVKVELSEDELLDGHDNNLDPQVVDLNPLPAPDMVQAHPDEYQTPVAAGREAGEAAAAQARARLQHERRIDAITAAKEAGRDYSTGPDWNGPDNREQA